MMRVLMVLLGLLFTGLAQAQPSEAQLIGQWEDQVSTSNTSYQLVFRKGDFAFMDIPQANLLDPVAPSRDKLYSRKWVNNHILRFAKLPELDPDRAKYHPKRHALMRIDSISNEVLWITISDDDWSKKQLDSIEKATDNYRSFFSDRRIVYQRLDLKKQKNKTRILGLWEDKTSTDSLSFQFFVQKGQFGFSKIDKTEPAELTAIRPNSGYNYFWIKDNILCYRRQPQKGLINKSDDNPNVYVLMRIEKLTGNELEVTLSSRPFDKAGLEFIRKEDKLQLYFQDNRLLYRRIPVVNKVVSEAKGGA